MNFSIYTSYFYQIRNFTPNMIPVSTCLSDPAWYRPPEGKEYYIDKRGIVCGLRYEPLIVQPTWGCPCQFQGEGNPYCDFLREYRRNLYEIDKEKTLKAFEYCLNKFNADTIVLIVYETPKNPCSERYVLQEFFGCEELKYPIDK
jgi:hypothetical protein